MTFGRSSSSTVSPMLCLNERKRYAAWIAVGPASDCSDRQRPTSSVIFGGLVGRKLGRNSHVETRSSSAESVSLASTNHSRPRMRACASPAQKAPHRKRIYRPLGRRHFVLISLLLRAAARPTSEAIVCCSDWYRETLNPDNFACILADNSTL